MYAYTTSPLRPWGMQRRIAQPTVRTREDAVPEEAYFIVSNGQGLDLCAGGQRTTVGVVRDPTGHRLVSDLSVSREASNFTLWSSSRRNTMNKAAHISAPDDNFIE